MSGPKAPVNPSTGRRDWDYTPPNDRGHLDSDDDDDDDDDFESDNDSDPYAGREHEEPPF